MSNLILLLDQVRKDEDGVTMVEYALLLGLISIVAIAAITAIGVVVNNNYTTACNSLGGAAC
jgi:pilus assembly protein Flp/PilA